MAGLNRPAWEITGYFLSTYLGGPRPWPAQPRLLRLVAGWHQRVRNGPHHRPVVSRYGRLGRGLETRIRLDPDPVGIRPHLHAGRGRTDGPD